MKKLHLMGSISKTLIMGSLYVKNEVHYFILICAFHHYVLTSKWMLVVICSKMSAEWAKISLVGGRKEKPRQGKNRKEAAVAACYE